MMIRDLPDRERPREKLAHRGAASLDNAELLALFLRTGTKGKSAIEVGREILNHFGSLHALGSAGIDALVRCPGLGLAKACQLAAAFELGARAAREQTGLKPLDSPERIHKCFGPQLAWLGDEKLVVALVNSRLQHLATVEISSGTLTETTAHPREVLRPAILQKAYGFALLHNHPSGDPSPSSADIRFTRSIAEAAKLMEIRLIDHVIIGRPSPGRDPYFSFREGGILG
ncbi:DNA repair protein radC [Haloferula helveola]|uniref:DNA repair protein radC n=1 Tax=Haloferula helveola TaxID=490095 RepID=A0ABN6GYU9_9BACT|nr:DNA repair protein radC [Haloferula helveola]